MENWLLLTRETMATQNQLNTQFQQILYSVCIFKSQKSTSSIHLSSRQKIVLRCCWIHTRDAFKMVWAFGIAFVHYPLLESILMWILESALISMESVSFNRMINLLCFHVSQCLHTNDKSIEIVRNLFDVCIFSFNYYWEIWKLEKRQERTANVISIWKCLWCVWQAIIFEQFRSANHELCGLD